MEIEFDIQVQLKGLLGNQYLCWLYWSSRFLQVVTVSFSAGGKAYSCDPFVLVPHEALHG